MRLLVSGATVTVERYGRLRPDRVGILHTPRACRDLPGWAGETPGVVTAADNDAFCAWDAGRFRAMLARLRGMDPAPLWVSCPDVVGDAEATLARFEEWEPEIRAAGLPVALVGQDGLEPAAVPWDRIDAFFVGGSTGWKLSGDAARLCREAKSRGKWVHMGRVNSRDRVRHAVAVGCDSVDGTQFSWFADRWIPDGIRWIDGAVADAARPGLFGVA